MRLALPLLPPQSSRKQFGSAIALTEINATIPASTNRSIPARRAARSVLTFKFKVNWRRTTIADSSSTELSKSKASRAGLYAHKAAVSATRHSTSIRQIVMT